MNYIEIIGYLGSLLVAISLSMKSVWKLRWINLAGSAFFAIYGFLIKAWPIMVVNSYICLMNIWYLVDYSKNSDCFSLDSLESVGHTFFEKFYSFYEDDIRYYFPEVCYKDLLKAETSVLFRNMIPVGIFSMEIREEGKARVVMDYLVPEFRDFKFGKYIYEKKSYIFRDRKISQLEVKTDVKAHQVYLKKLGFNEEFSETDNCKLMVKKLI